MGMQLARRVALADPGLTFSRISRAVRLTLTLEARTHRAIEAAAQGAAQDAAQDAGSGAANDDEADDGGALGPLDYESIQRQLAPAMREIGMHVGKDYEIRRAVDETIETSFDDPDDVERLRDALTERLYEDEVFAGRDSWPIGEAIALICQDLGLEPDWDRWETRNWARPEAGTSPPGSPYATVADPPDPRRRTGTQQYREARGLSPLTEPTTLRVRRGTPLPPGEVGRGGCPPPCSSGPNIALISFQYWANRFCRR